MPTRIDAYSLSAVPVEQFFNNTSFGNATAFVWERRDKFYLITNWHIVTCRDNETGVCLADHAGEPNTLRALFRSRESTFDTHNRDVALRDTDGKPTWLVHPVHKRKIDVVAVPIRIRLQLARRIRELALFNLAIDSKLRACDLLKLRVSDVAAGAEVRSRAIIVQKKTGRPVQFEITEQTRACNSALIEKYKLADAEYLFPSRLASSLHLSTRQYSRLAKGWVRSIGLNPVTYATHSLRRTKAALIYRKTGNLRAVQLLLGHTKLESTVRYLGIEVDDALAISEQVDL